LEQENMAVIKNKQLAACRIAIIGIYLTAGSALAGAQSTVLPRTPIKHLVIITLQDQSFDRYFGIYPHAKNPSGEHRFVPAKNTPHVDGFTPALLTHNPNLSNPYRMAPQEPTCDLGYGVHAQKRSYNHGLNNRFIWQDYDTSSGISDDGCFPQSVMGYYDGNTVTALWNYAQRYAIADHLFASDYTTEAGGMINLIAGTSKGVMPKVSPGVSNQDFLIQNNPPRYDDASQGRFKVSLTTANIGNLLNRRNVTWGYFVGGFRPSGYTESGRALFSGQSINHQGSVIKDYDPISDPFQYFPSTANPHHAAPESTAMIGHSDQAHHQYDLDALWQALADKQLPAVTFVGPKTAQNGRVGFSSPLDEQQFIVSTVNRLMSSQAWPSMAVMLVWSYSDGWYDHVTPPNAPKGMAGTGYGPRLPFILISPWAKHNFVAHQSLDIGSVLRFAEYNWRLGYLGQHSADRFAHSLLNMFDFKHTPHITPQLMNPVTGEVKKRG
jgi:phospholipase C